MRTETKTLISACRILARDIQSDDGVANAALAEIANRMEELEGIFELLKDPSYVWVNMLRGTIARPQALDHYEQCKQLVEELEKDRERLDWLERNPTINDDDAQIKYWNLEALQTHSLRSELDSAMEETK